MKRYIKGTEDLYDDSKLSNLADLAESDLCDYIENINLPKGVELKYKKFGSISDGIDGGSSTSSVRLVVYYTWKIDGDAPTDIPEVRVFLSIPLHVLVNYPYTKYYKCVNWIQVSMYGLGDTEFQDITNASKFTSLKSLLDYYNVSSFVSRKFFEFVEKWNSPQEVFLRSKNHEFAESPVASVKEWLNSKGLSSRYCQYQVTYNTYTWDGDIDKTLTKTFKSYGDWLACFWFPHKQSVAPRALNNRFNNKLYENLEYLYEQAPSILEIYEFWESDFRGQVLEFKNLTTGDIIYSE